MPFGVADCPYSWMIGCKTTPASGGICCFY
ncbi:Uncharacterised protein [Vibrio cholerae]|nr:Uncharacterised protein [Vibrio cholerae]